MSLCLTESQLSHEIDWTTHTVSLCLTESQFHIYEWPALQFCIHNILKYWFQQNNCHIEPDHQFYGCQPASLRRQQQTWAQAVSVDCDSWGNHRNGLRFCAHPPTPICTKVQMKWDANQIGGLGRLSFPSPFNAHKSWYGNVHETIAVPLQCKLRRRCNLVGNTFFRCPLFGHRHDSKGGVSRVSLT